MVITTKILLQSSFNFVADPCYDYKNLSDASRKSTYKKIEEQCDDKLPEGWYRFVGAAGTKMPTTRVPVYRCGTTYSGWLIRKDSPPFTEVCFSKQNTGCKNTVSISEKECGSYYIYKLYATKCPRRYCGSDWVRRFMYTRNFAQSSFFIKIIDQKCFKFHLKIIASVIITCKNMVDNRG